MKTTRESKLLRAELITPLIETGKVFLPQKAKWISDFLYEMTVFPAGAHSDQVDALSQALLFLKNRFDGERQRRRHRNRPEAEGGAMAGSDGRAGRRRRLRLYGGPRLDLFCSWVGRGTDPGEK